MLAVFLTIHNHCYYLVPDAYPCPAHERHATNMANSNTANPLEGKVRTSISEAQIDLIIFELKQSGLLKQAKDLNITEPNFYTALKLAINKGLSFDERKRRRPAGVGL